MSVSASAAGMGICFSAYSSSLFARRTSFTRPKAPVPISEMSSKSASRTAPRLWLSATIHALRASHVHASSFSAYVDPAPTSSAMDFAEHSIVKGAVPSECRSASETFTTQRPRFVTRAGASSPLRRYDSR